MRSYENNNTSYSRLVLFSVCVCMHIFILEFLSLPFFILKLKNEEKKENVRKRRIGNECVKPLKVNVKLFL